MSVDPGFTWDQVVSSLNGFLANPVVSALMVATIVLGLVPWIVGALRGMFGSHDE